MNNYVWVFGENLGRTANNNSFYFWKEVVAVSDGIDKYIVLQKNKENKAVYKTLSSVEKKYVVWKNSLQHFKVFFAADMYYVSLSYKDITPDKLWFLNVGFFIDKPLIYLQHGTLGIKKIDYTGDCYNNNMFRFVYYNKQIRPIFKERNNFKDYQLYYGEYHPRYKELVRRQRGYSAGKKEGTNYLWFLTWREYMGENYQTEILNYHISSFLGDSNLQNYLDETRSTLTVCLHQFFDAEKLSAIKRKIKTNRIQFVYASQTDVLDQLARNDVMITDYSSVGFDFSFLQKPVILFQPDLDAYLGARELYCDIDELKAIAFTKSKELVKHIIGGKYELNPFFSARLPENINYDYVAEGKHIQRMYEEFSNVQKNKISFVGYNFYGIGGTVFATRALAEALLEQNYMVELISLKSTAKPKEMPFGLQLTTLYHANSRRKKELLKRHCLPRWKKLYGYLNYDCSKQNLVPYAAVAFKKKLQKIRSKTVVSTRESLHLYLDEASSNKIKEKIYFFHCTSKLVNIIFPGVMDRVKKLNIEKAVFVTEESLKGYKEDCGYDSYTQSLVLGNTLESSRSLSKEEICLPEKEDSVFKGMYLVRMSSEREKDIDNLIGFGEYLKNNNINNVVIDVYGKGDYVGTFLDRVFNGDLEDYIRYCGETSNPKNEMLEHDAVVDFSLNHSFGMPYIEAILNGKMVYCTDNYGSREVLKNIDGCIYRDYADLAEKIKCFNSITEEKLKQNYDIICQDYSREVLAEKFINFIGN